MPIAWVFTKTKYETVKTKDVHYTHINRIIVRGDIIKIFISGHTSGIGKSLFNELTQKGHTVRGGSRRTGFDQSKEQCWLNLSDKYDIIFVNAGICEFDPESEYKIAQDIISVNLMGVYYALRNLPRLLSTDGSCWVTSSSCAYHSSIDHPLYAAAKTAACELVKSYAKIYNGSYKVNAVLPGFVATNLGGQQGRIPKELLDSIPLKRAMSSYEMADNLLKLASINYLNGALITIDGGEHA